MINKNWAYSAVGEECITHRMQEPGVCNTECRGQECVRIPQYRQGEGEGKPWLYIAAVSEI